MSDKYAALKQAAQEEIMCRESGDTSDAWQDEASPEFILELLAERDADKRRIAELTGKPAEEYPDDAELLFCTDQCDDLEDYRTAQWLKELRRRRSAGISLKIEGD